MELSILIARIIAVIYLSAALGGFLSSGYYRRLTKEMYQNAALTYLMGFLTVILGLLIVHHHNHWQADWTVLITVIGWLALIKGILLIVFPEFIRRVSESFLTARVQMILPYVTLSLGVLFSYLGFLRGGV